MRTTHHPLTGHCKAPASERRFAPRLPAAVRYDWLRLAPGTEHPRSFSPESIATLPEPARRWLLHAIAPGTPLRRAVELHQHGEIKLGRWYPFHAQQLLVPFEGSIWTATTRVFGVPVHGYDRFIHGVGDMDHRVLGRIPVASSAGPDHTRSAAARLASEAIWAPASTLSPDVRWEAAGENQVRMITAFAGRTCAVTLTVAASGALRRVTLPRWAKIGQEAYREHLFVADCCAEATFDGFTVPTEVVAGYDDGTGGWPNTAFIHQFIDTAAYR